MKRFLKICGLLFLGGVLLTGVVAAVIAATGYWIPDLLDGGHIVINDEVINLSGASAGFAAWALAWLAIWFALMVAALAVLFAFSVAGAALTGTALLLLSPLILIGLLIWWLMRRQVPATLPAAPA
jgi:hypothetical protein